MISAFAMWAGGSIALLALADTPAPELKSVTCADVRDWSNGQNVFVDCIKADGTKVALILSPPSGVDQASVGNRNAIILAYMQMVAVNPRIRTKLTLDLTYTTETPSWAPPGTPAKNYIQQVYIK